MLCVRSANANQQHSPNNLCLSFTAYFKLSSILSILAIAEGQCNMLLCCCCREHKIPVVLTPGENNLTILMKPASLVARRASRASYDIPAMSVSHSQSSVLQIMLAYLLSCAFNAPLPGPEPTWESLVSKLLFRSKTRFSHFGYQRMFVQGAQ